MYFFGWVPLLYSSFLSMPVPTNWLWLPKEERPHFSHFYISHDTLLLLSHFSRIQLFVTLWTVASQSPLSMGFSGQEYWRGFPCPPPGDLPDLGIEPASLMSPALAGKLFTASTTCISILLWDHYYRIEDHNTEPKCLEWLLIAAQSEMKKKKAPLAFLYEEAEE